MFIFFYMNISLFLRDAGASVRDIFKSNKTKMLVYVAIFVAGMILGFIFFNRIEQTEWLYVHTTDIVIVVVQSNNFFAVWFQNFWKCAKLVLVLFCLNLFSFGRHFHFLLIIIRGIVLGVGSVVLIAEFGFMGGVYPTHMVWGRYMDLIAAKEGGSTSSHWFDRFYVGTGLSRMV